MWAGFWFSIEIAIIPFASFILYSYLQLCAGAVLDYGIIRFFNMPILNYFWIHVYSTIAWILGYPVRKTLSEITRETQNHKYVYAMWIHFCCIQLQNATFSVISLEMLFSISDSVHQCSRLVRPSAYGQKYATDRCSNACRCYSLVVWNKLIW